MGGHRHVAQRNRVRQSGGIGGEVEDVPGAESGPDGNIGSPVHCILDCLGAGFPICLGLARQAVCLPDGQVGFGISVREGEELVLQRLRSPE